MNMRTRRIVGLGATAFVTVVVLAAGSSAYGRTALKAGNVNERRVLAEVLNGRNWLVNGGNFGSRHFSPLTQISDKNVGQLGLAWYLDIDSPMSHGIGADCR
jgi:glucose dehydrogenase